MEGGFHEWGGAVKRRNRGAVTDDGVSGLSHRKQRGEEYVFV